MKEILDAYTAAYMSISQHKNTKMEGGVIIIDDRYTITFKDSYVPNSVDMTLKDLETNKLISQSYSLNMITQARYSFYEEMIDELLGAIKQDNKIEYIINKIYDILIHTTPKYDKRVVKRSNGVSFVLYGHSTLVVECIGDAFKLRIFREQGNQSSMVDLSTYFNGPTAEEEMEDLIKFIYRGEQ